jgi:diadenosine tetraphosphate (Ap4A) HIT family hydrolase
MTWLLGLKLVRTCGGSQLASRTAGSRRPGETMAQFVYSLPVGEYNVPMTEGCVFCDHDRLREADLYFENEFCIYASTRDPRDPPDVIPGCGGIIPKVHRASLFDLTAEEWAATRELLLLVRTELHKRLAPDSYTLGWNDNGLHPHLHVIPRFDDEPMANQGVRSGIKDPANRRPDPWRPGTGRHMAES